MRKVYKKKPITEIIVESLKRLMRFSSDFNEFENAVMTDDFRYAVQLIKEANSKMVFYSYYLPKAITAILREEGYLITEQQAYPRATVMMLNDMAQGNLNEFYKFVN